MRDIHRRDREGHSPRIIPKTLLGVLYLLSLSFASAQSPTVQYIEKLRDGGYADLAIEYLTVLTDSKRIPKELEETIDFQQGMLLIAAADGAPLDREKKLLDQAIGRLQKYRKDKPDTDEAIEARGEIASILLSRAQRRIGEAKSSEKPEEAAAKREEARKLLEEARPELTATIEQYAQAIASAKEAEGDEKKGRRGRTANRLLLLESNKVSVELNRAMVEYLAGQAYDRTKPEEKKKSDEQFKKAIGEFNAIFQRYRSTGALIASLASLWEGKVHQEMGNYQMADDIYREILAGEPETQAKLEQFQWDLYAQARLFWYQTQNLWAKHEEVIDNRYYSAADWVTKNLQDRRSRFGLGIQLELAKAYIGQALKFEEGHKERRRLFRDGLKILTDMVCRYPSEFMPEGFALRDKYAKEASGLDDSMSSFDEALFTGDSAMSSEDYAGATAAYEKALTLVKKDTPEEKIAGCRYKLAFAYSKMDNVDKCLETADKLLRESPPLKTSSDAGGLVLSTLWKLYLGATSPEDKSTRGEKLLDAANYIESQFPRVQQADYARYLKGFLLAAKREFKESAKSYGAITPQSERYAEGQLWSGKMYWVAQFVSAKSGSADTEELTAQADKALLASIAAYDEIEKKTGVKEIGGVEAQLKRAEIAMKTQKTEDAAKILEPMIPLVAENKPEGIAKFAVDILVTALEAAIANGTLDKAEQIVDVVLKSDTNTPGGGEQVTSVLVRLGRRFQEQIKAYEEAGRNAEAKDTRTEFERFLGKIASRGSQNFSSLRYIAESYFALGDKGRAAELFGKAIELAESKPDVLPADKREQTLLGIRFRRSTALRESEQFQESVALVDTLLAEHNSTGAKTYPLHLEMEKATTLEAWASKDASKQEAALKQWTDIANKLRNSKTKPPQYFEARYGMASVNQLMSKKDVALQIAKSTMSLNPDCGGPAIKQKFADLVKSLGG